MRPRITSANDSAPSLRREPGKTTGPRFDTLIVRGEPAKETGLSPRTERYCTTEARRASSRFQERPTKSMSLKTTVGIAALAVLGCAAEHFTGCNARGNHAPPERYPLRPRFPEATSTEKSQTPLP